MCVSAKTKPGARDRSSKVLVLGDGGGKRLVADHVDAGVEEGARRGVVHVVGRDDRRPRRCRSGRAASAFAIVGEIAVGAVGAMCSSAALARARARIGRQRAGHQFVAVVQPRGDAVHGADEGALPAAHHAEPEPPGDARRFGLALRSPWSAAERPLAAQPQAQHLPVGRKIGAGGGEIVERLAGRLNDVVGDERGAFGRALLGVLQRAFPFQHRPAVEIVLRELGKDAAEIDLPVAQRAEPPGAVHPGLEAAVDALPRRRVELGVLHVEGADPLVIHVDEAEIVELLQHEVARIVEQAAAPVLAGALKNIS